MSEYRMEPIDGNSGGVRLWIKAVPGASREDIAGTIGERLKIRVRAPAEDGRANEAICAVIAKALNVKPRDVTIEAGTKNPEKTLLIRSIDINTAQNKLNQLLT